MFSKFERKYLKENVWRPENSESDGIEKGAAEYFGNTKMLKNGTIEKKK